MGMLSGLSKTRKGFFSKLKEMVSFRPKVDEAMLDSLEELLIQSDIGLTLSLELIDGLKKKVAEERLRESGEVIFALKALMKSALSQTVSPDHCLNPIGKPIVYLIIGINGSGKTTSIGKMAAYFQASGKKVILAAGDTFRAAAIEQLCIWAERNQCECIRHQSGADPAAVAFDAYQAAKARHCDVLLVDTAGRLHTKVNLMNELKKVRNVLRKSAPDMTLLVLDGTNGQNSLLQAREFNQTAEVDGIVLTKLDGTAKGGFVFAVCRELQVPVVFIGTGEQKEDLEPFSIDIFIDSFFSPDN